MALFEPAVSRRSSVPCADRATDPRLRVDLGDPPPRLASLDADSPLPPVDDLPPTLDLGSLYGRFADRLTRLFARRAGGQDALDLVHDAFARLAGLDPSATGVIASPEAYLSQIAINLLRDRARAAARQALAAASADGAACEAACDPVRALEDRDALARLERAVLRLPARRRRIFLLHRVEGLTYGEIAEDVGMSLKGVKKQMAKALSELRRDLDLD